MGSDKVENLAELGFRYRVTPLFVIAAGGGVGLAEDSPPFRGSLSAQYRAF